MIKPHPHCRYPDCLCRGAGDHKTCLVALYAEWDKDDELGAVMEGVRVAQPKMKETK